MACCLALPIVRLFNSTGNSTLQAMAETGTRIYFVAFCFVGVNIATSAFFAAVDRPAEAFCISLLRSGVLLLPLVFLFAAVWDMNGVWASYPVAELGTCLVAVCCQVRYWQKPTKTKGKDCGR